MSAHTRNMTTTPTTDTDALTEATKAAGLPNYAVYRYQLDRRPMSSLPTSYTAAAHQTLFHIAGELADLGGFHALAAQALTEIAAEFDTLARHDRHTAEARTYCHQQQTSHQTQALESQAAWENEHDDDDRKHSHEMDNLRAHARMTAYADAVRVLDIATDNY